MRVLVAVGVFAIIVSYGFFCRAGGYATGTRHAWTLAVNETANHGPRGQDSLHWQAWSDSAYAVHFGQFWQSVKSEPR